MSDLSPQAEALLEISRGGDDPTGRDRTRVRKALAGRIALGVAAGAAVATISKTAATATTSVATATTATVATAASAGVGAGAAAGVGISGLAAKLLLSAALVGAVGAGTVTYTQHRAQETRASSQVASLEATKQSTASPLAQRPPSRVEAPVTELTAEVAPPVPPVPIEALPAAHAPTPRIASPIVAPSTPVIDAPVTSPAPVEAPPKASSLAEEIALLQDAHAALQSESAARALGILDEHARRFPRGTLTEEREASRVSALCKLGRPDEARTQAADFLRDHPRSPQAAAVRASCAFDGKYILGR